ncbi:hypothetical protein [Mycobacteroides abscessus]|uniref:hypothetical protein n=1 Tax=Mycobacteroides abscessus TaxID=36809 RepID=UPI000940B50C|nr:hypothetical protein [Mycobacteroides abscessus]
MTTSLVTAAGEVVPGLLSLLAEDVYDFDDCGRKLTDRLTQRVDRIGVGCWLTDLSDQKVDQTTGRRQAGRDFNLVQPSNKIGRVSELPDHFFRHSKLLTLRGR